MIYQHNDEFKVFKFKATWERNETISQYITDKDEFEKDLLQQLQFEEQDKAHEEEREPNEVQLPEITYEDVSLTEEQQTRFDEISIVKDMTLDEVRDYVIDNIEPSNPNYLVIKLKQENKELKNNTDKTIRELTAIVYMGGMSNV